MTPVSPATPRIRGGAVLTIVLLSYFMILLDNSVIFTGLPNLQAELRLTASELAWVQDAYTLVFGGLLLLGARAGDLLGRKPVFITGLAIFSLASALVAVSPSATWIIAARALQGVGAAIVAPTSLSLITAAFEGEARDRAVAWYSATAGIGASLGMLVGGAAASWFSWRAGFFINVPIGLVMLVLAPRCLPEGERQPGRFDLAGAVASTLGVGAAISSILAIAEHGGVTWQTWSFLGVGVALLALFVVVELRAEQPILPLALFRSRTRTGAYLTRLLFLAGMIGFFYFTTQFLQGTLGFSPMQAGLAFLPMTLMNFAVASATPRILRRVGDAATLALGLAITLGGMLWLSRVSPASDYVVAVALPMLLVGAGQGLAFAPMTSFGIAGATGRNAGAASGAVNMFHQLGMSLGLGVLVVVGEGAVTSSADTAAQIASTASAALAGSSVLLALALATTVISIMPGHLRVGQSEPA